MILLHSRKTLLARGRDLFCLWTLAFLAGVTGALAQGVPSVVVDAQQTIGSGYTNPASAAVAANGTVYVADSGHNQVVQLLTNLPATSAQTIVTTTGFTLAGPAAVAVDINGDLFIGDEPSIVVSSVAVGVPRIIECVAANGVLTGTCKLIYEGLGTGGLNKITSATVDRLGNVFFAVTGVSTGIYQVASTSTATQLNFTGLPGAFSPGALVRDASNDIYFVNTAVTGSSASGVYEATYNSPHKRNPQIDKCWVACHRCSLRAGTRFGRRSFCACAGHHKRRQLLPGHRYSG